VAANWLLGFLKGHLGGGRRRSSTASVRVEKATGFSLPLRANVARHWQGQVRPSGPWLIQLPCGFQARRFFAAAGGQPFLLRLGVEGVPALLERCWNASGLVLL